MNNVRITLFVIVGLFGLNSCENGSQENIGFRLKNSKPNLRLGEKVQIEVKSNDFKAVQYLVLEKEDTLSTFNGEEVKLNFKLNSQTVGIKKLIIIGVTENGDSKKKMIRVEVFSNTEPLRKEVKVLKEYAHNSNDYTQGLFFDGDTLFESTGLYGESRVKKYLIGNEGILQDVLINERLFGEGITLLDNHIYELTWKSGVVLVYDRNFNLLKEVSLPFKAEGWGLTNDGKNLIMSDGSGKIRFLNPENLRIIKEIDVYDNQRRLSLLNELELVEGELYANIYQSNYIAKIDIGTGKVLAYIDCSPLEGLIERSIDTDVLNGVAYNESRETFFLTGKKWNKLFEVAFE